MKRLTRFFLLLPLSLLFATGCRNGGATADATTTTTIANNEPIKAVPDKDRYKVKADTTGFFRYSPLQASGSDLDLKKNAHLTMLQHGRGYSQVKTEDNQIGYVGTDDIVQLSPAEIAQEDAATLQAAQAAAGGAQLAGPLPTPTENPTGRPSKRTGPQNTAPAVTIPSDAGRNERLPEADARPTATPAVNFR